MSYTKRNQRYIGIQNVDEPQNLSVEEIFQDGSFTFTSLQDPSENTGVYKDPTDLKIAMINREPPIALASGGRFIRSGREIRPEYNFLIIFSFGVGVPKMKCPTQISEIEYLKHYLRLSL